jgi:hypothetical protein
MMMVDHKYYENLTPARVDEILDGIALAVDSAADSAADLAPGRAPEQNHD